MSDDFMPAISMESTTKPVVVSSPTDGGSDDLGSPPADSTSSIRESRNVSQKTRDALRGIAKLAAQADTVVTIADEAADLEPMEHEPALTTTPASPSRAAEAQARAATKPEPTILREAPAAPQPDPQASAQSAAADIMARAEEEQRRVAHELRVKALEERAKQLEDREKAIAAREKQWPDRTEIVERPAAVLSAYLKEVYGVTSDEELKEVLSDVVTDISENVLGIKMPDTVKSGLDSRKAVRTVRAYKADVERRERALKEEREAADKAAQDERAKLDQQQRERQAVETVTRLVNSEDSKGSYPHLHALAALGVTDNPAGIVVEIIREQLKKGQPADWKAAALMANNHYKPRVEKALKEAESLRARFNPSTAAPAPAVAAAKPAPVVSQVPGGQVPRPQTLTAAPTAAPTTDTDGPEFEDHRDRRHGLLRASFQRHRSRFVEQ